MWFKFFHKHNWSTPHHAENCQQPDNKYVMICFECGATRDVTATLSASSEVERRIERAKEILDKVTKAS